MLQVNPLIAHLFHSSIVDIFGAWFVLCMHGVAPVQSKKIGTDGCGQIFRTRLSEKTDWPLQRLSVSWVGRSEL